MRRSSGQAAVDVAIRRVDQRRQRLLIHLRSEPELHMAHALAAAFQKRGRIWERCAVEEADGGMGGEGVHISEGRSANAGGRHVIVKALSNIVAKRPHLIEPALDQEAHRVGKVEPRIHGRIAPHRAGQQEEGVSAGQRSVSARHPILGTGVEKPHPAVAGLFAAVNPHCFCSIGICLVMRVAFSA